MGYKEKDGNFVQYQGQSFSRALYKKSGAEWKTSEIGAYELTDTSNKIISSGDMTKSVDKKSFVLLIGKTITSKLDGLYKLRAYARDNSNLEINDVIADYRLKYITGKATSEKKR